METYNRIGRGYGTTRRADPRIAARILAALGDAHQVVNIGAGAGSYEPANTMMAIEPSQVMIDQRPPGSAPVLRARAEAIPLPDGYADAALAVLTVHHWNDLGAGLREIRRIARRRVAILTWDETVIDQYWLIRDYLPATATGVRPSGRLEDLLSLLDDARVETVPVPHDCADGFLAAYWRRPEAYLDPAVRAGISHLAMAEQGSITPGLNQLARDLRSGSWHIRHADLLERHEYDAGYRLVTADWTGRGPDSSPDPSSSSQASANR